ncbi:MAG: hypothetical protein ACRC8S_01215 [Fimbriiglobus sp.]
MCAAEILVATMMLTIPPGIPAGCPDPQQFPALRDAILQVAVEWEILDERETRYVLSRPEDFCTDLNMLRRRYQDLKDAPKTCEALRLPERSHVNELIRFNRSFRKKIDEQRQLEIDRADSLRDILCETDRLYQVWDSVRDARCDFYYITVRRQALKKLKSLIGEEDYATVTLPPNVPLWRFNEMSK